jgi:Protein of unknown function (DUF2878)
MACIDGISGREEEPVNWPVVINAVLFQLTWFAAVLGGSLFAMTACALLTGHLAFRDSLKADAVIGAITVALGLGLDTLWIHINVLDFHGAVVAPMWIVVLWAALGLSLNHSMAWFISRPFAGAILAGACAPLSYLSGAALGAVFVPDSVMLGLVSVAWFALFYVLFKMVAPFVNRQFQGVAR